MSLYETREYARELRAKAYDEFLKKYRTFARESYNTEKEEILNMLDCIADGIPRTAREIAKCNYRMPNKFEIAQNLWRIESKSSKYTHKIECKYIPELEDYEVKATTDRKKTIKFAEVDDNGNIIPNGYTGAKTIKLPNLYTVTKN